MKTTRKLEDWRSKEPSGNKPEQFEIKQIDGVVSVMLTGDGYGGNSTATFIQQHVGPLSSEIASARTLVLQREKAGRPMSARDITRQFPNEIGKLCSLEKIAEIVTPVSEEDVERPIFAETNRQAALGVFVDIWWPQYSEESIDRMSRPRFKIRRKLP